MIRLFNIIFLALLTVGCSNTATESISSTELREEGSPNMMSEEMVSPSTASEEDENSKMISQEKALLKLDWPEELSSQFDSIARLCVRKNLNAYGCEMIEVYYANYGTQLNTSGLNQIDSLTCEKLFQGYQSSYGTFHESYFYSIDKPINGYYPLTMIQYFGVVDRPLMMVLFDSTGRVVNAIEVANSYGETGGCLSTERVNDSTLLQHAAWSEMGIDQETGEDIFETTYAKTQLVISSSGKVIKTELERGIQESSEDK